MAQLNDLEDVTISNPKVGDVVKYTATGWQNGADATGTPPGGNPCGELDDFLRRDIDEEITGTYTWTGEDGVSKIIVESPTETTQLTGGSVILTDRATGESGRLVITNDTNDTLLRSNQQLYFKDSTLTSPVSLAELVACCDDGDDGGGDTGSVAGFAPIMHDFNIDLAAGQALAAQNKGSVDSVFYGWDKKPDGTTDDVGKGLRVTYPISWAQKSSGSGGIQSVMVSEEKQIAMPAGATGAILMFQGSVSHRSTTADKSSHSACHTAHRLIVNEGATFVDINQNANPRNDYFGTLVRNVIYLNGAAQNEIRSFVDSWCKFDMIEFPAGANVTFSTRMDVQKGGRNDIRVRSGRLLILPFAKKENSVIFDLEGFGGDFRGAEEDLQEILDFYSPPLTPAEESVQLGRDLREQMRHAISALDSRKLHPPIGSSKTQADYEQQIGLLWGILDSNVLLTYEATVAAVEPIFEEIRDPEYGVADLFQFEIENGAVSRSLF